MYVFAEVGILVAIAALMALAMRALRQPLIIGHILTGLVVGPFVFDIIRSAETLRLFSQLGIAFLLFIVGLSLSPKVIKEIGRVAVLTGIGQVAITSLAGYWISIWLGFPPLTSLYIAVALSFSSTIIILKLISDKGDLDNLYAKISIGFLLVQDLIAVGLIFILPLASRRQASWDTVTLVALQGVLVTAVLLVVSHYLLPRLHLFFSRSQELLFLFANAWGMGIAALFLQLGFPLEGGALIAGVTLSNLPSRREISARLSPLRDFFIVIFFILLGSQLVIGDLSGMAYPVVIFSLLVLVGNPIILMAIMGWMGYRKSTSFNTGVTVAQISEFSLILVALGVGLGHVEARTLTLVTLVGLVTIFGSTYLILYSDKILRRIAGFLSIFERRSLIAETAGGRASEVALFGYNRIGYDFLEVFKRSGKSFVVIDYDPQVIRELSGRGVHSIYGDAGDADFINSLNLSAVKLAVSTVPDPETNLLLLGELRAKNTAVIFLAVAHRIDEAAALYKAGANFVIMPHFLGGKYASEIVESYGYDLDKFASLREKHLTSLSSRLAAGQEHPPVEKN